MDRTSNRWREHSLSWIFGAYVAVTAPTFLLAMFAPDALLGSGWSAFTSATGRVFMVVQNVAGSCKSDVALRQSFVSVLIAAVHGLAISMILVQDLRNSPSTDTSTSPVTIRDALVFVGAAMLALAMYRYIFFAMASPATASSSVSYLCWNLAVVWLLYTLHGLISVAAVAILAVGVKAVVRRFIRRLTRAT